MIPFQYNNEESINFINSISKINIHIDSVDYDDLRRIDKEKLFDIVKEFYREMFLELSNDLEEILINDAKGIGVKKHQIKYIFNKEYKDSITNNNLSSTINLNGTIMDYFTLGREYIHLIGYYNNKNCNEDLREIESSYIEKELGNYLVSKDIITEEEFNNIKKSRINGLSDSINYCNDVINGKGGDKDKYSKCMSIIYGELISKNIDNDFFVKYIRNKDTYNNIDMFSKYIDIDDYINYIDSIKIIPKMEIINKRKKIFGLFRGK